MTKPTKLPKAARQRLDDAIMTLAVQNRRLKDLLTLTRDKDIKALAALALNDGSEAANTLKDIKIEIGFERE